jgi:hypothetical protein
MKLKREDIKKTVRSIKLSPLTTMNSLRGVIFIPFEVEEVVEEKGNGVILMETKKEGSKTFVKPGLIIRSGGDVRVAYVSTEYAAPFNFKSFVGYVGKQESPRRTINNLSGLDFLIVREDYVLVEFSLKEYEEEEKD